MRIISGTARGTKLYTLEGSATRPTLDRIKESLFSIIQSKIPESIVLDLFAGSGALGLETLSRGASFCVFCDHSKKASNIVKQNIEKTNFIDKSKLYTADYKTCINQLKHENSKFDIIFLDPPYDSNLINQSVNKIIENNLLSENGIIVAETDNDTVIEDLKQLNIDTYDIRKYGRVKVLLLKGVKNGDFYTT